jgi:hypothetical protein
LSHDGTEVDRVIEEAILEAPIGNVTQAHTSVSSSDTSHALTKVYQGSFDT